MPAGSEAPALEAQPPPAAAQEQSPPPGSAAAAASQPSESEAAAPGAAWPQPGGPGAARGREASQEPRDGPSAGLDSLAIQRTCSTQPLASSSAQSLRETPRSPAEEVRPLSVARAT
eukprot:9317122-Lingulodinium_polyedra.AAC.1